MKKSFLKNEKGVALIFVFFLMLIILTVVLSVSVLLYGEAKVLRNIGNSMVGLYAADSGIEKVLYYDRQVLPTKTEGQTTIKAERGLCMMTVGSSSDGWSNNNACTSGSTSVYCNGATKTANTATGCNPNVCDNCTISFTTTLDTLYGKTLTYLTTAKIRPTPGYATTKSDFEITSRGTYGSENRQIEIITTTTTTDDGSSGVCGDGICLAGVETCTSCLQDCGACSSGCGNGTCSGSETCSSCPNDCGVCGGVCGDGSCTAGEDCSSCSNDCGTCSVCSVTISCIQAQEYSENPGDNRADWYVYSSVSGNNCPSFNNNNLSWTVSNDPLTYDIGSGDVPIGATRTFTGTSYLGIVYNTAGSKAISVTATLGGQSSSCSKTSNIE